MSAGPLDIMLLGSLIFRLQREGAADHAEGMAWALERGWMEDRHPEDPNHPERYRMTDLGARIAHEEMHMPDPDIRDRLDAARQKIADDVERVGWAAVGVFPTEDTPPDERYSFTYTVGFTDRMPAEVVITRLDNRAAHSVLLSLWELLDGNDDLRDAFWEDIREGGPVTLQGVIVDLPVQFRRVGDVDDPVVQEHFAAAVWWHRERRGDVTFDAWQLLWPDPEGRLPGDPGYDDERYPQPLLGEADRA